MPRMKTIKNEKKYLNSEEKGRSQAKIRNKESSKINEKEI
jgi:hypothetical protein